MHPVTFADVNKAEGDNTNRKETVQEVDEEVDVEEVKVKIEEVEL